MLTPAQIQDVVNKGLCCLPKVSARYIRAIGRGEEGCDFLPLAMALDALTNYTPDGNTLLSYTRYNQTQVDNPPYTENARVRHRNNMNLVKFENRWDINVDITRFIGELNFYVFINNVLIGQASGVNVTSSADMVIAARDIINSAGHDYEASGIGGTFLEILTPTNFNQLRSGINNSGRYKKDYVVNIYADGIYPPGMCDYEAVMEFPVSEWAGMVFKGMQIDGVYSDFQTPVSYINNFPYGTPLYDSGIQKQIDQMVSPGNVIITYQTIPDPPNEDLLRVTLRIKACTASIELLLIDNAFYPDEFIFCNATGCGTNYFRIQFTSGGQTLPLFGNNAEGAYLLGLPPQRCTYGVRITDTLLDGQMNAIVINGVRYSCQYAFSNVSSIQTRLNQIVSDNGLTSVFSVVYDTSNDPPYFTILKTNYSYDVIDAISYNIDGIERVVSFEKLSCLAMNAETVSIPQTPDLQCYTEQGVNELISIISKECCADCGDPTTPAYPVTIDVIGGHGEEYIQSNPNPIQA